MNSIDQMYELVPELIEETKDDGTNLIFSDRAKEVVKEVAEFSRKTKLYQENKERGKEFWSNPEERTARNIYIYMLDRIVNAPTSIHRDSSVILLMPVLDEAVNGTEAAQ